MTAAIPDEFLTAFDRVWSLPAGMEQNAIMHSREFLDLCNVIDKHCYARLEGNLMHPYLLRGLQTLGLCCFFPAGSLLAAGEKVKTCTRCYEALMQSETRRTYLCPLDCAGDIPYISFRNATIRHFSRTELDEILNSPEQQRQAGYQVAETGRLSRFLWLVVEKTGALPTDFAERYWLWPRWHLNRDKPGTVYPYQHPYPEAVQRAIFELMLAPWEEWLDCEDAVWRPFDIPWIHTLSDDIFQLRSTIPSASSLTWIPRSYCDDYGDWHEYEAPHEYSLSLTKAQLYPYIDAEAHARLETAIKGGVINTAAQHQFVKAFQSAGVDEFLAHIVAIDACVGEKSVNRMLEAKFKKLGATGRLKYRLAGLLNDASVKASMDVL